MKESNERTNSGENGSRTTNSLVDQDYPNAYAALPSNVKGITCPHTGLRHAHLAKLLMPGGLAANRVRVVTLREPGARHGKTLFHLGDMLRWLDELAAQQACARKSAK